MNGDALKKRYEVKDTETGEILDEPLYVLRPLKDRIAQTTMFVYSSLCSLSAEEESHKGGLSSRQLVAKSGNLSYDTHRKLLEEHVLPELDPAVDSVSGLNLRDIATSGLGSDGSVEWAEILLEDIGFEIVDVVCKKTTEEKQQEATKKYIQRRDAAQREEWKERESS